MSRIVFFDLDGTLAHRQAEFGDAVTGLCRARALPPDPDAHHAVDDVTDATTILFTETE
ncbi:hypothetical protein [Streptomyces colonosanans]|uniref:hypothetical protein n=1 Tax=Streptomyces colonosanans TaxID=1428652 RepID=UPI0015A6CE3A|nr:hypothetical protein [Streptomyces colonosanans]